MDKPICLDVCPCEECEARRAAGGVIVDPAELQTLERHLIGALRVLVARNGRRLEIVQDRRPKR